jgi:hypothetical protein
MNNEHVVIEAKRRVEILKEKIILTFRMKLKRERVINRSKQFIVVVFYLNT